MKSLRRLCCCPIRVAKFRDAQTASQKSSSFNIASRKQSPCNGFRCKDLHSLRIQPHLMHQWISKHHSPHLLVSCSVRTHIIFIRFGAPSTGKWNAEND